jgi:hypothetical protein
MIPGKYNMICPQGSTFSQNLTWLVNEIPVNLTGFAARMQVREKHTSPTTVLSLVSPTHITLGASAGTIDINVSASATSDIVPKDYVYDLEMISSSNIVSRIIEGKFIVTPEVTR